MTSTKPQLTVPIPDRMKHLPRDPRGYPIPWIVYRDTVDHNPHFAINDEALRFRCLHEDLCGICGLKLFRGRWLVGGPLSAFHQHGAFADPPMHSECAHYALLVCPHLAAPRYTKNIGASKLPENDASPILVDRTVLPDRPIIFLALMSIGTRPLENLNVLGNKPYHRVEYWRNGTRIADDEGEAITQAILSKPVPELHPQLMIIR